MLQVFFRYKTLLEKHLKELAELCSEENGKTYGESVAEIEKSIELTEFATSLPQLVTGVACTNFPLIKFCVAAYFLF